MANNNFVFIGGNFSESQLLWVIHIVKGYMNEKKIKGIILNEKYNYNTRKYISKVLGEDFKLCEPAKENSKFNKTISVFFHMPASIIYCLISTIKSKILNKNLAWWQMQFFHAIWDSAIASGKDGDLKPSLIHKIKSVITCHASFIEGMKYSKKNIEAYFLGHSVYKTRAFISGIRFTKSTKNIYIQACECIYKLPINEDISVYKLPKEIWDSIIEKQPKNDLLKFKEERLKGITKNFDTKNASKNSIVINEKNFSENQIFLHTFRDSPYNFIDKDKIFSDYIDWATFTFKIINQSDEKWSIRIHPSSFFWGENSISIVQNILNKLNIPKSSNNLIIENNKISNLKILEKAKRIVTYSGTVALEACSYGIKPITIATTSPYSYNKNLVYKPKNKLEYKSLLLRNSNSNEFNLKENYKNISWKLLYAIENQISLSTFLNSDAIFRGDSELKIKRNYQKIMSCLNQDNSKRKKLFLYGEKFAKGLISISANSYIP
tara:strand:- start:1256 stop:2734 length:1479 start_codon:yes stop_codon:yes gene_type:complete